MQPSDKSPGIANFLEAFTGRITAITTGNCVPKPFGCGEPIGPFRDTKSQREYTISGLCQTCQDSIFGFGNDDDDTEDN